MYRTIDLKTLYQLYDFKFIVQFESWYLRNIILIVLVKFNLVYLNIHTSYDFKTSYNFQLIEIIFDKRLNGWCWFTEFVMWDGEMDGLLINLFIIVIIMKNLDEIIWREQKRMDIRKCDQDGNVSVKQQATRHVTNNKQLILASICTEDWYWCCKIQLFQFSIFTKTWRTYLNLKFWINR